MIPLRLYSFALGAIGVATACYALLRRKSKTAEEIEQAACLFRETLLWSGDHAPPMM